MLRRIVLLSLFTSSCLFSGDPSATLHARRIFSLWKTSKRPQALQQAKDFLEKYPQHPLVSQFLLLLAEHSFQEKRYPEAHLFLKQIEDPKVLEKARLLRVQTWARLRDFSSIYQLLSSLSKEQLSDVERFFLAVSIQMSEEAQSESAKELYLSITEGPLALDAIQKLAEIALAEGENKKAANYYLQIADQSEARRAESLFRAGHALQEEEEPLAKKLLKQAMEGSSSYAAKAAITYGMLELEANPHLILNEQSVYQELLEEEFPSFYHLLLGFSHYRLENYSQALPHLEQALSIGSRSLFLAGMHTAQRLQDPSSYKLFYEPFLQKFPNDPQKVQQILIFAALNQKESPYEALRSLNMIQEGHPLFEKALIERARLQAAMGSNFQAISSLHNRLLLAPSSLLVTSFHQLANQACRLQPRLPKEELSKIHQWIDQVLSLRLKEAPEATVNHCFLYADTLVQTGLPRRMRLLMSRLIRLFPEEASILSKAHTRLAELAKLERKASAYLFHLKRALAYTKGDNRTSLHLRLFNFYLQKKKYAAAAKHLLPVYTSNSQLVKKSNMKWLANYLYHHIEVVMYGPHNKSLASELLLEDARVLSSLLENLSAEEASPLYSMRLSQVYLWLDQPTKALHLLHSFENPQGKLPQLLRAQALLKLGKESEANALLDQIANINGFSLTQVEVKALYTLALSHLQKSPSEAALALLEKVWQSKKAASEPLHLEASIDWLQALKQAFPLSSKGLLQALQSVQQSFASQETIMDRDYLRELRNAPKKLKTYEQYLLVLDLQIANLERKIAIEAGDMQEAEFKEQTASILKETLNNQSHSLPIQLKRALLDLPTVN